MKTLNIKKSLITLLIKKIKNIEIRSCKTNYRRKLYMPSYLSYNKSFNKKEVSKLLKNNIQLRKILCRCIFTDCIYIDEQFIEMIKKEIPINFKCEWYRIERFALALNNVILLMKPMEAWKKLEIWNCLGGEINNEG